MLYTLFLFLLLLSTVVSGSKFVSWTPCGRRDSDNDFVVNELKFQVQYVNPGTDLLFTFNASGLAKQDEHFLLSMLYVKVKTTVGDTVETHIIPSKNMFHRQTIFLGNVSLPISEEYQVGPYDLLVFSRRPSFCFRTGFKVVEDASMD